MGMSGFAGDLAFFAAAFAVAIASPGPFAAALVARGIAFGFPSAAGMAFGGLVGDVVFASLALFGLTLVAHWAGLLIDVLRYGCALWLIWLGYRLLTARSDALGAAVSGRAGFWRGCGAGAALSLGNPKAALFYAAVFPGFFGIATLTANQIGAIYLVIATILIGGHLLIAMTASRFGRMLGTRGAVDTVNRLCGGVLAGAGIAIAAS
jgi:threonine/homoserine/homoserine lactone efflux protein